MKKGIFVIILFLSCLLVSAQQGINVSLQQQPVGDLFDLIEKQTDYSIFCVPGEMDSLLVSVSGSNAEPVVILQRALQNTPFRVSVFQNSIYIIKDKALVTKLPDNFYKKREAAYTPPVVSLTGSQQDEKASSEHKVYAIGNDKSPSVSKVTLKGTVTDFKTGNPMPGVTLYIENPLIAVATNAAGQYTIQLPAGRQELSIRGVGIRETKRQLMLYNNGKLDIELEEKIYSIREVTIQSDRIDNVKSTAIGVERLKMKNIKNIPTAFGEADIMRIVLTLPGVKSVGEISSGFNVRGGATDQNLILYNDGIIFNPTHLFGLFSTFNPDIVNDMELYKSSIPAKYGGRISSVLDINSREGNREKIQGSASIGLLTSRLTLEGPIFKDKTSFMFGGRTTYSDWLLGLIPEKNGFGDASAGFYDINASVTHRFDDRNTVSLNTYYSHDRFRFDASERYSYHNAIVSGRWRHVFYPKLTGIFAAGYDSYGYHTEDTANPSTSYALDFGIGQAFGKADFSYYPNDRHSLTFGISSMYHNLKPGNYLPEGKESLVTEDRVQTEKALESAVYLGDKWDLSSNLSMEAGIRYSMFNVLGPRVYNIYAPGELPSMETVLSTDSAGKGILKTYHGPEFRFSLRYAFGKDMSVKAGVNTMRQYIHKISNNTIMAPTDTWKLSDVNIRPQAGTQFAAGLFKNFANNTVETSIEIYYKIMDDYLDYRSGAELIMNHHIETEVAGTRGKAYGAEFMLRKMQGPLNGWVSYTYSRTMLRKQEDANSPWNSRKWYPADFDKPHEFKLVGNYKFTHRYSFSLNCDYSTGRPVTLPIAKYEYAGGQFAYYADRNKYRIPDFFRMDVAFNIEAGHRLKKLTHSSFSFGVYNLTGRKNAYSVYYISNDGVITGYKLSVFGVPIPYISYNIKF